MDSTTLTILAAVLSAVSAAVGAVAGATAKWAIDRKRMEVQEDKQQGDHAFQVYSSMVATQQAQIDSLVKKVQELAEKELECRQQNLEMKVDIKLMAKEIELLKRELGERSSDALIFPRAPEASKE